MKLTPMIQKFVLHFGEMGSHWGINRTVGQMYALLVISETPLNADQMAEALGVSRSNISMGLKELQSWRLVKLQHIPGDRKEYYSAPSDVWEIARTIIEERRKREIEPTLSLLRDVLLEPAANDHEVYAQQRMQDMHDLIELVTRWSTDIQHLRTDQLHTLLRLGAGVSKILEFKDKALGGKQKTQDRS